MINKEITQIQREKNINPEELTVLMDKLLKESLTHRVDCCDLKDELV